MTNAVSTTTHLNNSKDALKISVTEFPRDGFISFKLQTPNYCLETTFILGYDKNQLQAIATGLAAAAVKLQTIADAIIHNSGEPE